MLSFTLAEGKWNDPAMVAAFESVARDAAPAIGGLPVKLPFLDLDGDSKKEWGVQ